MKDRMKLMDAVRVVGAGPVGLCAALMFVRQGLRVQLVGQRAAHDSGKSLAQLPDARLFALTAASKALLQRLRVWDQLTSESVQPVHAMHVYPSSGSKKPACLVFDGQDACAQQDAPGALSWMVSHASLMQALTTLVDACTLGASDTTSIGIDWQIPGLSAGVDDGYAGWTFAADGGDSKLRGQAGLAYTRRAYFAQGVVMSFRLQGVNGAATEGHGGIARQWFIDQSVLALLPMPGQGGELVSMVWSRVDHEGLTNPGRLSAATVMAALQQRGLLARVQHDLGCELLPASDPVAYPLFHGMAPSWVQGRVVLLGDAAHQVHPLAGQGLNLGLEDVAALAELWRDGQGMDVLTEPSLQRWARRRRADIQPVLWACDALWQVFSSTNAHLNDLMAWGLLSVNRLPGVKRWLVSRAMRG